MSPRRFLLRLSMVLLAAAGLSQHAAAEPIGLVERYALASDRTAVLQSLIPGSEDYYFYHCLHYQVTGELERAESFLADWERAVDEDRGLSTTPALIAIRDRQRLLTYGASPERTIEYLRRRLNLNLDHTAPPNPGQRQWPERLDPELLRADRVIDEAVQHSTPLTPVGLARLADRALDPGANHPANYLSRLTQEINGPWYPRLGELVIAELRSRPRPEDRQFGDRAAHSFLTLDALRKVAEAFPELAASDAMIHETLQRLRPDDDSDMHQQPDVRLAYLQRVDQYCQTLPDAHTSLKVSALYRLLEAYWMRGEYPEDLFLRYLRLPRQSPIIYSDPFDRPRPQRYAANLAQDFSELALLPPIHDEQPLVRAYLEHFLRDAESTEQFDGLVRVDYLRRVFAETKLLYGVGDPARWYQMLSPAVRQQVTESAELTLAPVNPHASDVAAPAAVEVDLKNVDELIVRVYEINTHAYYRSHTEKIDTDIDLDGLVATSEQRFRYELPEIRRHRERIELPAVEGRGVWVVDLLGGGLRARAVLRRGDLRYAEQMTVDGHSFTVLDENRESVENARMLVGGREWLAGDDGRIIIPPIDEPVERTAILMDDQLAVPVKFQHRSEDYQLVARMLVNRQQLVAGRTAKLVVRPRLSVFGIPVDPAMLEDVTITVTAVDHDGIQTTRRFTDVELDQHDETVVEFRVPGRVALVSATVEGHLTALATGRQVDVSASHSWEVNGVDKSLHVYDLHLTRNGPEWIVEARGRNGEPVAGTGIQVQLQTVYRQSPVEATLETGDSGRVVLGRLPGVTHVTLNTGEGVRHWREIELADAAWPTVLHATSAERLRLPLADPDAASVEPQADGDGEGAGALGQPYRLLALRAGEPAEDVTSQALAIESGMLRIGPLSPGDYHLLDRRDGHYRTTAIAVTEGPVVTDIAAGQVRNLELVWPEPVSIATTETTDEALVIHLSGSASMARVHVLGSRYLPPRQPFALPMVSPGSRMIDLPENGYVSDLRLGDEILYVLRRQYAEKYPGVMLPQPSLLIAPWETDQTNNVREDLAEGEALPPSAAPEPESRASMGSGVGRGSEDRDMLSQNLAFLASDGVVLANLEPGEDGTVRIPLDELGDSVFLQVVVVDGIATVERTVVRELPELEPRDLRLATPLAPDEPFALERGVLVAGPGKPLDMSSVGTAQVQIYTSVAELLQLYRTLSGDPRLDEFVELGRWHTLDEVTKRQHYGRLACHELHIFLKAKDPEFFASVVRPYLENKKEKQLVDHWLLDRDLTPWTDLWQYARLNAFEKALLAREVPAVREAVLRELRERIELQPPDPESLRRLVEAGLAGKALLGDRDGANRYFFEQREGLAPAVGGELSLNKSFNDAFSAYGAAAGRPMAVAADEAETANEHAELGFAQRSGEALDAARGVQRGGAQMLRRRANQPSPAFFQQLDATKQWADNHWDHVRVAAANDSLIPVDPFWLAWAEAEREAAFISEHLLRPSGNRHAALVALALLDLPLEASQIELPAEPDGMFEPEQTVAIVSKRLRSLEPMEGDASLLVGQRFEAADAPAPDPNDDSEIQIAPDEFLTGRAYRGQIVLTNPTPRPRTVDVLWQIPAGSLPLAGGQVTDSRTMRVEPFEVQRITYEFYFPAPGDYVHYPVCISHEGKVLARSTERTFHVVETPTQIDEESWEQIARNGSAEKIREFLGTANLRQLNLSLVAHRMRDRAVYDAVISVLDRARVPQDELWAYSLLYRDQPRMETFLENRADLVASVGPVLESPIMQVHPIPRALYEHLEYAPLVRARIHPLREEREILNDRFLEQYRSFMKVIAYQRETAAEQELALTYYLLLQNRIEEALDRFARVERPETELNLQYDYLSGYLALHRADFEAAIGVAQQYADHPVPRWRQRFAELASQLQQRRDLLGGARLVNRGEVNAEGPEVASVREDAADLAVMDRERRQEEGAASTPDVSLRVEGDRLVIDHRNTPEATIRFYGVDLELLFSKTPFVRSGLEQMAMVRPGRVEEISLGAGGGTVEYRLNDELARQTLLVEVIAGPARDTALYYGGRLKTYVSEGFGQLQVSDRTSAEPVSTAYVKVYAKMADGSVQFYKDGYTDARGRFDYATLSTGQLDAVESFAILVLDTERGATLHEAAPPRGER